MNCSTTTAYKWLKTGMIPHTKIGSIYLFNEIEVLEALKNRTSKRPNKERN
jgi:excisionase family DNA binding protein